VAQEVECLLCQCEAFPPPSCKKEENLMKCWLIGSLRLMQFQLFHIKTLICSNILFLFVFHTSVDIILDNFFDYGRGGIHESIPPSFPVLHPSAVGPIGLWTMGDQDMVHFQDLGYGECLPALSNVLPCSEVLRRISRRSRSGEAWTEQAGLHLACTPLAGPSTRWWTFSLSRSPVL
jgi:hypothetical protein